MDFALESSPDPSAWWPRVVSIMDDHSHTTEHPDRILRLPLVLERTGLTKSTLYRMIAARRFPSPVRLSSRIVGWRQTDIERWSHSLTSPTRH